MMKIENVKNENNQKHIILLLRAKDSEPDAPGSCFSHRRKNSWSFIFKFVLQAGAEFMFLAGAVLEAGAARWMLFSYIFHIVINPIVMFRVSLCRDLHVSVFKMIFRPMQLCIQFTLRAG